MKFSGLGLGVAGLGLGVGGLGFLWMDSPSKESALKAWRGRAGTPRPENRAGTRIGW